MNIMEKIPTLGELFRPGNPVHIDFITDRGEKIYIPSRIHKVDLLYLTLELFEYTDAISRLALNHTVTLICFLGRQEPQDFVFFTKFIKLNEENRPLMVVSMPDNFHLGRQSERYDTNIPFGYYDNEQEYRGGVVCNISNSGLLASIKPDDQLTLSQNIPFKINLPNISNPLAMTGRIVRIEKQVKEYKIALSFQNMNSQLQSQL